MNFQLFFSTGKNVDCDNSTRLGPNKQCLFEHLLQADPARSENKDVFQSVPQLAVYDRSPNSIRPNESLWRRKSDSNALPRTKETQGLLFTFIVLIFCASLSIKLTAELFCGLLCVF